MARTPDLINIPLRELMRLLYYRWAATKSEIGDLGVYCVDDLLKALDEQSRVAITPLQLADLVHHMKECVYEKEQPVCPGFQVKNHNEIMKQLAKAMPDIFKELPTGEVVMVELEDRVIFGEDV